MPQNDPHGWYQITPESTEISRGILCQFNPEQWGIEVLRAKAQHHPVFPLKMGAVSTRSSSFRIEREGSGEQPKRVQRRDETF